MSTPSDGQVAVLVGNGLSLAFNPDLGVGAISAEVIRRIRQDAEDTEADRVSSALQRAAASTGNGDPMTDFEVLVGSFEVDGSFLDWLRMLAEDLEPEGNGLPEAFKRVADFSERIRLRGMSHVLQVIAERSVAHIDQREPINEFVDALLVAATGRVTIANLNYDALLLSCLTTNYRGRFCDMASGYGPARVTFNDGTECTVNELRRKADFNAPIRLLGLHGSLTWWKDPTSEKVYKFPVAAVRSQEMWEWLRTNEDEDKLWMPQVVLATQSNKAGHVTKQPFRLPYEEFSRALDASSRWLIVGYSFRDDPVNDMLRTAFMKKSERPNVLIVTKGDSPTQEEVEYALGWAETDGDSRGWLTISRDGAVDALGAEEWQQWSSGFDLTA